MSIERPRGALRDRRGACRNGRWLRRGIPRSCTPVLCLAFVLLAAGVRPAAAQAGRDRVLEGNRLYEDGRFDEAHQKYLEAMAEAPGVPLIPFNDGNALYQSNDYQRAMEAYQRAIETGDPALASAAWYNLGNALYRQQQLEPSLEAYKEALRLNPADLDAKHNLERVLEQMQQQEQQQQQQSDQDEQDEDEEQPDQEQQQQQQDQPQNGDEGEDEQPPEEQEGDQPPQEQEATGEPEPRPGEMTPQEAERLLDAIEEDPDDVNRKRASARGRRPKKPW